MELEKISTLSFEFNMEGCDTFKEESVSVDSYDRRLSIAPKNPNHPRSKLSINESGHPFLQKYEMVTGIVEQKYAAVKEHGTEKTFFLKIIPKKTADVVGSTDALRALEEGGILKRVTHPNVCEVHDIVETSRSHYLVLELLEFGFGDLEERISGKESSIFLRVLEGLAYCHSRDVVHGDLCISRIRFNSDFHAKLVGFSKGSYCLQCLNDGIKHRDPSCIAPEARELNCSYDGAKADVYSLGCVLYYIMHYKRPSRSGTFEFKENLDESLKELIVSMTQSDPDLRPNLEEVKKHPWVVEERLRLKKIGESG